MMKFSLIALILFTVIPVANAQIYKWIDENGETHYTQTPPEGVKAIEIKADHTKAQPLTQDFSINQPGVEGEVDVKDMKDDSGEITVIDTDKLKKYCDDQRRTLSVLKDTKRISVMEDGKSINISEEEKQKKIENIQQNLQQYCQ